MKEATRHAAIRLRDSSDDVADAVIEDLAERLLATGSPRASVPRVAARVGASDELAAEPIRGVAVGTASP
jgi:hypothetical protein